MRGQCKTVHSKSRIRRHLSLVSVDPPQHTSYRKSVFLHTYHHTSFKYLKLSNQIPLILVSGVIDHIISPDKPRQSPHREPEVASLTSAPVPKPVSLRNSTLTAKACACPGKAGRYKSNIWYQTKCVKQYPYFYKVLGLAHTQNSHMHLARTKYCMKNPYLFRNSGQQYRNQGRSSCW